MSKKKTHTQTNQCLFMVTKFLSVMLIYTSYKKFIMFPTVFNTKQIKSLLENKLIKIKLSATTEFIY